MFCSKCIHTALLSNLIGKVSNVQSHQTLRALRVMKGQGQKLLSTNMKQGRLLGSTTIAFFVLVQLDTYQRKLMRRLPRKLEQSTVPNSVVSAVAFSSVLKVIS